MTVPSVFPASVFRTSTNARINTQLSNIQQALDRMLETERQLSSGYRVNVPSDDPLAATRAMYLRRQIEQGEQFVENIQLTRTELEYSDDSLGTLQEIVQRAYEIYLESQNAVTATVQGNAVAEVETLIRDAVNVVNRQFQGRYIFGGRDGGQPPAQMVGAFVNFAGSEDAAEVAIAAGEVIARNLTAAESIGGFSARILGNVDLDPRVTTATKLRDLNGGEGVPLGELIILDGLGHQKRFDLSNAETVGDVLNLINADGIVTATINVAENGIDLSVPGGNVAVLEVNEGTTAAALGIAATGAGPTLNGTDMDRRLSAATPLADLRGGLGIDLSGIEVTNGGTTETIAFDGAVTVEDVLSSINLAGAFVRASVNADGTGLDLRSSLNGGVFTVAEHGGTSASELGWSVPFTDLELGRLNNGLGISTSAGHDLRIELKDGSVFEVDLSNAASVQDVLDLINNAEGNPGTLVASVPAGETRLELEDSSGGAGSLVVTPVNGSLAAQTLGILERVADPGTTLVGDDLAPAGFRVNSLFDTLIQLRDALGATDGVELDLVGERLQGLRDRLLDARAEAGVRVTRLEFTRSRHEDQKVRFQTLLSDEREVNLAEAVVEFEKNRALLEASYSVTGRLLSLSLLDFLS